MKYTICRIIRDANKHDKPSSKLVPKSTHTAQDAILKQT